MLFHPTYVQSHLKGGCIHRLVISILVIFYAYCVCASASGFKIKELRGKLAIGITANFINHHTTDEAQVPEISGVARIYNQKFFQELQTEMGMEEGQCGTVCI